MIAMNNKQFQTPNIESILAAYATVANMVADAVNRGVGPDHRKVELLAALSSAVLVVGSEYRRHVLAQDVAQGERKVQLQ